METIGLHGQSGEQGACVGLRGAIRLRAGLLQRGPGRTSARAAMSKGGVPEKGVRP